MRILMYNNRMYYTWVDLAVSTIRPQFPNKIIPVLNKNYSSNITLKGILYQK